MATAKATEIAMRNKNVAGIAATQRAQEEAVGITVAAEAEKEAAEARAMALRTEATAETDDAGGLIATSGLPCASSPA